MKDFIADEPYIPDLTGISVAIATPSHDGKYEGRYMKALHRTAIEIERLGGKVDFFEYTGCADIALARAKIFGRFYRSNHTHLMHIDADQGWRPEDVVRLILLDREFIGGVSVKKQYPLVFAVNHTDDVGNMLPLIGEPATGVVRVSEVGLAFMLMKRSAAEKMVAAYPETAFDGEKGDEVEYALFDPTVINRRRRSEDYEFCRKWRQIGGEIELLSTIRLTHTGSHTWAGALSDELNQPGDSSQREYLAHNVEKQEV